MQPDARTCIAYIAGSLITGKREFSFYDYSRSLRLDMSSLPHARCLSRVRYAQKVCLPDLSRGARYRYACGCGHYFDIVIHGNTFIGYILDCFSHFIGNVRGDSIYLYDHRESAHFNYRISRDAGGDGGWNQVCVSCVAENKGRMYEG